MHDFWPASGYRHLATTAGGRLKPTDAWLRSLLALPELDLVEESGPAETALHRSLHDAPSRTVAAAELAAVEDDDARANYAAFLGFRDALLVAGTLEGWYLGLMHRGAVTIPPPLIDRVVEAIVRHLLDDTVDAFEARAGELLFRAQRLSIVEGRMLAADRETADRLAASGEAAGPASGTLASSPPPVLDVLTAEGADTYWARSGQHDRVLDLTHEIAHALDHGLSFRLTRTHSGLKALARVLEKWVAHLLGVTVAITPLREIDDAAWRWHVGLDPVSMALLNDLYDGVAVDPQRLQGLISLFRLDFADPQAMRADLAGRPVYLGLAMTAESTLKLKPQNLLLNLPLATAA